MATARASADGVHNAPETVRQSDDKKDITQVERVLSVGDEKGEHADYNRIDQEVAKYAGASEVFVSEEENKRLKKMIDRRVLPIMVITYFLQSLDKGTMSATSIMGIRDDVPGLLSKETIVGGLLAYAFSTIRHPSFKANPGNAPIRSWQAIFICYGCISFLWGLYVIFTLPDSPMRAKCWSEEDKKLMVERVRSNQTGLQNKKFRAYQFKEALLDPQTYCYMGIQIFTTLPTSGLGAFYNIIIQDLGFDVLQVQLLAMVLGVVIIATLMGSAWMVKKTKQNLLTMAVFMIPAFTGTIVIMTVKNTNNATKAGLLISYWIIFTFWAAQGLGMSMLTRNVGGQTKKSVCITMNFFAWCAGNAIGPKVFFDGDPRYLKSLSIHLGCYSALLCVIAFLRFNLMLRNKKKDREFGKEISNAHGFDDLTDKENPNFRYVY
ncbi:allantoate permease [Alternaria alternata]|nr:allantoate permease [Alternaria alternata]